MSWTNSKNSCITEECLNKTGKIELVQTVRTCNQDCKLGWEYRDPKEGECCGECEQTYCIENGILHQINMPPGYLMIIARLIFVRLNTAIRYKQRFSTMSGCFSL
ncbi:GSCOCG00003291001-RA-CDS [Cotesia congregata]|nr:GSCOCG00003291001-RA-CDS [Cotesia congregata]